MLGSLQLETRREPRPGKADQPAAGSSRAAGVTGEDSFADRGPAPERRAACPLIRGMAPRITGQTGPECGTTCPGNCGPGGVPVDTGLGSSSNYPSRLQKIGRTWGRERGGEYR